MKVSDFTGAFRHRVVVFGRISNGHLGDRPGVGDLDAFRNINRSDVIGIVISAVAGVISERAQAPADEAPADGAGNVGYRHNNPADDSRHTSQ